MLPYWLAVATFVRRHLIDPISLASICSLFVQDSGETIAIKASPNNAMISTVAQL